MKSKVWLFICVPVLLFVWTIHRVKLQSNWAYASTQAQDFATKYKYPTVLIKANYLGISYYGLKLKNIGYYNPKDVVAEFKP